MTGEETGPAWHSAPDPEPLNHYATLLGQRYWVVTVPTDCSLREINTRQDALSKLHAYTKLNSNDSSNFQKGSVYISKTQTAPTCSSSREGARSHRVARGGERRFSREPRRAGLRALAWKSEQKCA